MNQRTRKKYKIMLETLLLSLLLTKSYYPDNIVEDNKEDAIETLASVTEDVEADNYKIIDNLVILKNVDELERLGIKNVTFDELRETVESNPSLTSNFFTHKYIMRYIDDLELKMPNVDLRVLNHNLKTIEINITPEEEWENKTINGFYSITGNKIGIRHSNRHNIKTFYHELSHALTNTFIRDSIEIDGRYIENAKIYRGVKEIYNPYAKSMDEGMNTVITAYLLSDNYKTYFDDVDLSHLTVYTDIVDVYYEGYKLIHDDYPIEEYLNGYYTDFESELSKYDIYDLIPMCDVVMDTEGEDKTSLMEDDAFITLKEDILRNRLVQLKSEDISETQIIQEIGVFDIDNNYDIYYNQFPDEEHIIEVETNHNPNEFNTNAKITSNGNVLYDAVYYNIYIYIKDGEYRFALLDKTIRFGTFDIYRTYYDLITHEYIDNEQYKFYSISTLANGVFNIKIGTSRNHKITFDTSVLNDPIVIDYYDNLNKQEEEHVLKRTY